MVNFLLIIGITIIVSIIGGGLAYIVYIKTRPPILTWNAKVYQLGGGIRDTIIDKDGNIIKTNLQLKDLRPYTTDILQRIEKEAGRIVYKLKKLNLTTNAVTADMVEVWNKNIKEIDVLVVGSTATVLSKGYDNITGSKIFQPKRRETIELAKSEIIIQKNRLNKEKDILQAITPWIIAGMAFLSLIALFYIGSEAYMKSAETIKETQKYHDDQMVESAKIYKQAIEDSLFVINNEKSKINKDNLPEYESIE